MPTLYRFGSGSIRIFADDQRPPHVHIVSAEFHVLVRISDWAVIAGEARPTQVAEAMAWIEARQAFLALAWAKLNERE